MAESGVDIGSLYGRVELQDNISSALDVITGKLEKFESGFKGAGATVAEEAAAFFSAEAALKLVEGAIDLTVDKLKELTLEGATIAGVEDNFNRLAIGAGRVGETMLGVLREGTHNTITDFDLMKDLNDQLSAGVHMTDVQLKTLATGGFALAQAKGMDVKQAFETLNDAMLTGRVRAAQELVGKIDLAKAEEVYATKIGTTTEKLKSDEKIQAAREALLNKVAESTGRLGEQTDRLDDKIAQINTRWKNFQEELGMAIATSPVVGQAFDTIRDSILGAFGLDKQQAIDTIKGKVETLATSAASATRTIAGSIGEVTHLVSEYSGAIENTGIALGAYYVATNLAAAATGTIKVVLAGTATLFAEVTAGTVAASAGIIGVAAALGAIVGFQIGKLQPISDFFERMTLRVEGYSAAEAEAMVATHRATDEAVAGLGQHKQATEEATAAAKGLTAAEAEETEQNRIRIANQKKLDDLMAATNETFRMSKDELKAYSLAWENLNTLGSNYRDVIATIDPKIQEQVIGYAKLGATVADLAKAFPTLTQAQAEAAVTGVKAAQDLGAKWDEVLSITNTTHGDSIKGWLTLEDHRYERTVELLRMQGKATEEMLDLEKAKHVATVDSEIRKREEQIVTSKGYAQKQVEDAKAKLDLMLSNTSDFIDEDIRLAEIDLEEKERLLERWDLSAREHIRNVSQAHTQMAAQQREEVTSVNDTWDAQGHIIDANIQKVRTLTGEIITQAEADKRRAAGGAFDVTSQNFMKSLEGVATTNGWNPSTQGSNIDYNQALAWARVGYSFQEILTMFANMKQGANGRIPPPQGPRIPGFKEGGIGEFGEGTMAVLHGREAIIPLDNPQASGFGATSVTNNFYVNGTGADVARIASDQIMRQLKSIRQFGAA